MDFQRIICKLRNQKYHLMSSKRRRKETKKIRDSYPTKTLKELEETPLMYYQLGKI